MRKDKFLIFKALIISVISLLAIQFVDKYITQFLMQIVSNMYLQKDDLMLIPSDLISLLVYALIVFAMFLIVIIMGYTKKVILKEANLLINILICSFVLSIVLSIFSFFTYTRVSPDGITVNGLINHKFYKWEDIKEVEFQCNTSRTGKYFFDIVEYILRFNDNGYIDLGGSLQFKNSFKEVEKHINTQIPHTKYIQNEKLFEEYFNSEDKIYINQKFKNWNED